MAFLSLTDNTEFLYKTNNFYNRNYERCLKFDDIELSIKWPIGDETELIVSEKRYVRQYFLVNYSFYHSGI